MSLILYLPFSMPTYFVPENTDSDILMTSNLARSVFYLRPNMFDRGRLFHMSWSPLEKAEVVTYVGGKKQVETQNEEH